MRRVAPVALDGVTPRDNAGEAAPSFDVVRPRDFMVDDAYQRNPPARSLARRQLARCL